MKKRFTFLISVLFALILLTQSFTAICQVRGNTAYYTLTCSNQSGNSAYASYYDVNITDGSITMTWNAPGNQTITGNVWRIGGAKGTNVSRTITGKTAMGHSISQIVINHNGRSNSKLTINSVSVTISYNSGFTNLVETITKNSPSVSSSGSLVFEPDDVEIWPKDCYYKITVVYTHNKSKNYGLDITSIDFKMPTYTVTYDPGDGSGEMTDEDSPYEPGQTVTLLSNSFNAPGGKEFDGWIVTDEDDAPVSVSNNQFTMPSKDVTVTAQWRSSGDPNIVINGGNNITIASPAATGPQSTSIAYNNMTGHKNEEIALYYDSECTSSFPNNGWFTASLGGTNNNTLNYSAALNEVGERTVYIKVTSYIGETPYYSVISATQATSTRTITYQANGGTGANVVKTYGYGTNVTILAYNDDAIGFTAPVGSYFKNWKDGSSTYNAGVTITSIATNYTLSAQWEAFPKYYLVTNANQIVAGKHYVIANSAEEDEDAYGIGAPNGTYRDRAPIVVSVDSDNNPYITKTEDLYDFVLSGKDNNNKWTLYDKTTGVYLYGGSKGTLGGNDGSTGIPATAKFSLTLTNDGDIEFNNNDFIIEYNGSASRFASYAGTCSDVYLYVKEDDNDLETYSDIMLSNNWTVTGNLTIQSGIVTVPSAKTLTVTGTLTNNTAANLVINDGGQLITTSKNVNAKFNKDITAATVGYDDYWYLISSPIGTVTTASVTNLLGDGDHKYNLYKFNEATGAWNGNGSSTNHFESLSCGNGYLYRNNDGADLTFAGTVVTGTSSVALTRSETNLPGFNLLGNPYSHNITSNYLSFSNDAEFTGCYTLKTDGTWTSGLATSIKPGEGFFVQVNKATTVTFNQTAQRDSRYNQDYIQFSIADGQYEDVTFALFDKGIGLDKINHRNAEVPMIYINQNGQDYAIATMSDDVKSFSLNFKAMKMGQYTLSYKAKGEYNYLHVIDRLTGADVDMLLDGEYSFIASPTDSDNRFIVRLAYLPDYGEGNDAIFAFQSGSDIYVSGEGELQVFDVLGRFVMSERINGATSISADALSKGVYVLRIVGSEIKTQKIVVR